LSLVGIVGVRNQLDDHVKDIADRKLRILEDRAAVGLNNLNKCEVCLRHAAGIWFSAISLRNGLQASGRCLET